MTPLGTVDADALYAELTSVLSDSEALRSLHRLLCVVLVCRGRGCAEVAHWLGISPRSVERWVQAYADAGLAGLQAHHCGGRPTLLSEAARTFLPQMLNQSPASQGVRASCWTGPLLAQHLETRFGVRLSVRQCQRMLRVSAGNTERLPAAMLACEPPAAAVSATGTRPTASPAAEISPATNRRRAGRARPGRRR